MYQDSSAWTELGHRRRLKAQRRYNGGFHSNKIITLIMSLFLSSDMTTLCSLQSLALVLNALIVPALYYYFTQPKPRKLFPAWSENC